MRDYLDRFDHDVIGWGEPYGVVLDLRFTKSITPRQRAMLTESMERHDNAALCKGTAMVFESRLLRGILTAVFWLRKPAYPTRVFTTTAEAWDWMDELFPDQAAESPTGWRLQSPASRERATSEKFLEALRGAGATGSVEAFQVGEDPMFAVWTEPQNRRATALAEQERLAAAGIDMSVVPVRPNSPLHRRKSA